MSRADSAEIRGATIDRLAATLELDRPVSSVKLVSPAREKALAKFGIRTVRDLLSHYPFRYIDLSCVETIGNASIGETATIAGSIHEIKLKRPRPHLPLVEITLVDGSGTLIITCFRQPWLAERLSAGMRITVAGKIEFDYGFKRMTNPFLEILEEGDAPVGRVIPVYHATERLSSAWIGRIVGNALEACCGLEDPLPLELRVRYRLESKASALRGMHEPESMDETVQARRRLVYEELLLLELSLMSTARERAAGKRATVHIVSGTHLRALADAMPFRLTEEQQRARDELLTVMSASSPADHLMLGDVGTGKTAVAAFGLAAVADTGTQALMMAPTEVLALQYAEKLGPSLDAAGIRWEVLTGSTPPDERAAICSCLQAGDIDVLFGTHVLLEDDVSAPHVSFVVIDEQQRFGVEQRRALVGKGEAPDVLSMTATPIPRSLALAVYGNMTLSYLKGRPLGTGETTTAVCDRERRDIAYDAARAALAQGRQVYVVCPLVGMKSADSEGEKKKNTDHLLGGENDDSSLAEGSISVESDADLLSLDTHAAQDHARFLKQKVFADERVGLLHGRMSGEEKQHVMDEFRDGAIKVLVATTVIEVGIDVPNATVMIVEDADRFGLAQLHQLRGRVGRGKHPGEMYLLSGTRAPLALRRLEAMERISDGFALSEYDLSLRREGDILGNRQHGASSLKLVNIMRDTAIIETAHADAAALMEDDPELSAPEHRALAREMRAVFSSDEEGN